MDKLNFEANPGRTLRNIFQKKKIITPKFKPV